ncbi:hypothetical protein [Microbacterium aerolatum]|uniref:Schlafen AlbA-2 domain-containing protein n=1 Tax=Microbacterium aerolatum TaxID=153731 RepID=A0A511AAH7_9MICO|nr:hypothetical protein [Microbacterium aerolatum]GEK85190.1 hypothetical protein MAE01_03660 [Microbacterium aerolatum]GGB28823.1 hypothetical protein GCM10007198_19150 [Microbacterium aerolatum]
MGIVDTSKLPTGNRARAAFLAALEASDDRVERHYLELKSGFDLNDKADRRKVVKFVLGASHRDPAKAGRHFDGHAVMVLGLTLDGIAGVPKFELMDLERDIEAFAGSDPPGWDIDLVPAGGGRDYVLLIVDPPDLRVRPVLQSSDSLVSGDVYIRVEGATRKATGPELVAMISRAGARLQSRTLDVIIEPVGFLQALVIDAAELRGLVSWHTERLEAQVETTVSRSPFSALQGSFSPDRRSRQQFLDEVEEWRGEAFAAPASGLHELASQMTRPFALQIVNNTTTSLRDVRVDMTFDASVTALYWEKQGNTVDVFSTRPTDWGKDSYLYGAALSGIQPVVSPDAYNGSIRVAVEEPAELVIELRRLHAEQRVTTPDEDVILVFFADGPDEVPQQVTASWRLTAGEVHEVLRGEFQLELARADWREPLRSIISGVRAQAPEDADD